MSEKVIDVKGLKVRFETDRGCVYAVNGVDLSLNARRDPRPCRRDRSRQNDNGARAAQAA